MQRLLVVRRGGLGDTLLMLPVLRALRRAHPAAALHVAGVHEFAAVLQVYGACDLARSSEDLALWSPAAARERLAGYDQVLSDDPAAPAAATATTVVRVFDPRPRDATPIGLQIAASLGLAPRWPDDGWLAPPFSSPAAGPFALAPGSGGRAKCWPRAGWIGLAAQLAAKGRDVRVVVGPTEIERDDPRAWPWPVAPTFVVEPQVAALAAALAGAAAFVGNDSGTTHLAAMLGVPTVALFGASDARVWAPAGPHVRVLTAPAAIAGIEVEAVAEALRHVRRSAAAN
jgi:hypothetical protein